MKRTEQPAACLEVEDLSVSFAAGESGGRDATPRAAAATAVDGVSFVLGPGECVGLVGESGSGKTVTSLAILGLLPETGTQVSGSIRYRGRELLGASERDLRAIRGGEIAMIFQEPMTALNPVFTIASQLRSVIRRHRGVRRRRDADAIAVDALRRAGMQDPQQRLHQYPHELSGGLRQRVLIAMALACEPRLLIADEPTTALDVTTQAQVLAQLAELQQAHDLGLLLITHDLGVVAQLCERVLVMYAGEVVEAAPVEALFVQPLHPYTRQLMLATPRLDADFDLAAAAGTALGAPAGRPAEPAAGTAAGQAGGAAAAHGAGGGAGGTAEPACRFAPRCPRAQEQCVNLRPRLRVIDDAPDARGSGRLVACHYPLRDA